MKSDVIRISGLRGTSCAMRVEKSLLLVDGVRIANVSSTTQAARVVYDERYISASDLRFRIRQLGFEARPDPEAHRAEVRRVCAAALVLTAMLGLPLADGAWGTFSSAFQLACGSVVILGTALRLRGWAGTPWAERLPGLLGAGLAWGGACALFFLGRNPNPLLFAGSVLACLFLAVRLLQVRSTPLQEALRAAQMQRARLLRPEGEFRVRIDELVAGEQVALAEGDIIPVDGRVVAGAGRVDESLMTGLHGPVDKGPQDPLFGTSRLVAGALTMEAGASAGDGAAARLGAFLEEMVPTPVETRFEQRARLAACGACAIALAAFLAWFLLRSADEGVSVAVAVLAAAAGPWSVVGFQRLALELLARRGVAVRGADVFERCGGRQQDVVGVLEAGGEAGLGEDVRVAMGSRDPRLESADVVLLNGNPRSVADLLLLAELLQQTVRVARRRTIAISLSGVGLAVAGLLPAVMAGLVPSLGVVSDLWLAARLRRAFSRQSPSPSA